MWDQRSRSVAVVLLGNVLLHSIVTASPIYVPHFLPGGTGRNIRHLPCVSRRTGETGVCMFAFTCAKANGTHLGTCIDRFYFGSCCKIEEEPDVFPQDNSIDDGPSFSRPFVTSHRPLDSNDIPEYFSKPKPLGGSTQETPGISQQVSSSLGPGSGAKDTTKTVTRRPAVTITEATTEPIRFSTFQSVGNASSTASGSGSSPIGPSSIRPSNNGISEIVTRPLKPSSAITTMVTKRPATTSISASEKPVSLESTTRPSSATPAISVATDRPTPSKKPAWQATNPPETTLKPFGSTQKFTVATRFPPRNTTSKPTQSVNRRPTVPVTKRPSTVTKRPSTTKKPSSPSKRPATSGKPSTVGARPATDSPVVTTIKPNTETTAFSSLSTLPIQKVTTKKPLLDQKTPVPVTGRPSSTKLPLESDRPPSSTISSSTSKPSSVRPSGKPTGKPFGGSSSRPTTTSRPTSIETRPSSGVSQSRPTITETRPTTTGTRPTTTGTKPTTTGTRPTTTGTRPTTTGTRPTTTGTRPTTTGTRPTTTGTRPTTSGTYRPIATETRPISVDAKPTVEESKPPTIASQSRPTPPTTTLTTSQSKPKPSLPTKEGTKPAANTTEKVPTTSSSSSFQATKFKPTEKPTKPGSKPTKPLTKPIGTSTPTWSFASSANSSDETTTATTQSSLTPQVNITTDAILQTTYSPGLVTWSSNSDEFATKPPEVTPAVTSSQDGETDGIWTPIIAPDGWIMIQSPTTEKPQTQEEATTKPVAEPTQQPVTSEETEATTKEPETKRPSTTTPLPSPVGVTIDSSLPVPMETLNMSDYKQVCGRRLFPESRIVGGNRSSFGKWPWQISLRQWRTSTYLHKCGAALLNENWAITAAHCVENVPPSDLLLRIGEHDLANEEEPYGYQERRVQIVASHPQFDPRTFEYDLALLRFYEPLLPFQPNVLPICLPDDDENYVGRTAYVTGWGRLYDEGPLPSVLQEVAVPVINNTVCEAMYKNAGYIEHIPNIFICAGWRNGGSDSCEGDSGGPMVIQRAKDKRWILAGVISWGIGCAVPNQPGVYTRISEFREWINQILQF